MAYTLLKPDLSNVGLLTNTGSSPNQFWGDQITQAIAEQSDSLSSSDLTSDVSTKSLDLSGNTKKWVHTLDAMTVSTQHGVGAQLDVGYHLAYFDETSRHHYLMTITKVTEDATARTKEAIGINTAAYDLNGIKPGAKIFDDTNGTLKNILSWVFADVPWNIKLITNNQEVYPFEVKEDDTAQAVLQAVVALFGVEVDAYIQPVTGPTGGGIIFGTSNAIKRVIEVNDEIGSDKAIPVIYGKNMTALTKTTVSDVFITRFKVVGADGLTIESVNNGSPYLVDDVANQAYNPIGAASGTYRDGTITNSAIKDAGALLTWGKTQMAQLNHPRSNYEVGAVFAEGIALGDSIVVQDLYASSAIVVKSRAIKIVSSQANPYALTVTIGEFVDYSKVSQKSLASIQVLISDAKQIAIQAKTTAESAQIVANDAKEASDGASTIASEAKQTANEALDAAFAESDARNAEIAAALQQAQADATSQISAATVALDKADADLQSAISGAQTNILAAQKQLDSVAPLFKDSAGNFYKTLTNALVDLSLFSGMDGSQSIKSQTASQITDSVTNGAIASALSLKADSATLASYALVTSVPVVTSATTAPSSPKKGDIWVNTAVTPAANMTYSGSAWVQSGIKTTFATAAPTSPAPVKGDVWVNTSKTPNQVTVYNGSAWVTTGDPDATAKGAALQVSVDAISGEVFDSSGKSIISQQANLIASKVAQTDFNTWKATIDWTTVSSLSDMDTYVTTNHYFYSSTTTVANQPVAGRFYFEIIATGVRITQRVLKDNNANSQWVRNSIDNGTTWTAWEQIGTLSSVRTQTDSQITDSVTNGAIASAISTKADSIIAQVGGFLGTPNNVVNSEFLDNGDGWRRFASTYDGMVSNPLPTGVLTAGTNPYLGSTTAIIDSTLTSGSIYVGNLGTFPVSAGQQIVISTTFRPVTAGGIRHYINYYDAAGKQVTTNSWSNTTATVGTWTTMRNSIATPAGAVTATYVINVFNSGVMEVAKPLMAAGTVSTIPPYQPGPRTSNATVLGLFDGRFALGITNNLDQIVTGIYGNSNGLTISSGSGKRDVTIDAAVVNLKNLNASLITGDTIGGRAVTVSNSLTIGAGGKITWTVGGTFGGYTYDPAWVENANGKNYAFDAAQSGIATIDTNGTFDLKGTLTAAAVPSGKPVGYAFTDRNSVYALTRFGLDGLLAKHYASSADVGSTVLGYAKLAGNGISAGTDASNPAFFVDSPNNIVNIRQGLVIGSMKFTGLSTYAATTTLSSPQSSIFRNVDTGLNLRDDKRIAIASTDGEGQFIIEATTKNTTYTDGFRIQSATMYDTVASGTANLVVNSSGTVYRSSSATKYKTDIRHDKEVVLAEQLLTIDPAIWRDKGRQEMADELYQTGKGEALDRNTDRDYRGLIAEDLVKAGLEDFVEFNGTTGEVEGIHYDRLWTILIPLLRQHRDQIQELQWLTKKGA